MRGSTDPGGNARSDPRLPQWRRGADRDMGAQAQSTDRSIPVRRQPRICRKLASADNSAQAAATANALRLFDRRTAPTVGSDSDPPHGPQSSSSRNVPHAAAAPLRNRHAHRRGIAIDFAGCRLRRKGHHHPLHKILQDLVPIGPKLADELAAHLERRGLLPMPLGRAAPLFASRGIRGWSYPRVITMFQHVRRAAGINCPVDEPRPPRLHDLRHTAAVHRVITWYGADQDVQRLLPQLATYLGHLDIRSTQRYLRMRGRS